GSEFRYNENVARGHDFDTLEEFLTKTKEGYCEQFAGAMAVMARIAHIPSRVAIGFAPGNVQGDLYIVTTKHAHAWVELYFPGYGWLPFEPTPRADITAPSYTQRSPGTATPSASASPKASTTATPSPTNSASRQQLGEGDAPVSHRAPGLAWWLKALLVIGG